MCGSVVGRVLIDITAPSLFDFCLQISSIHRVVSLDKSESVALSDATDS